MCDSYSALGNTDFKNLQSEILSVVIVVFGSERSDLLALLQTTALWFLVHLLDLLSNIKDLDLGVILYTCKHRTHVSGCLSEIYSWDV